MPSTPSLTETLHKLTLAFPDITFQEADDFSWSPHNRTVHYNPSLTHGTELLLHELSHGLLDHRDYSRDIELLAMEVAAWQKATEIAPLYGLAVRDDIAQDNLDTYRDWLHARSTCPACSATGFQVTKSGYQCPACTHLWRVNEARSCALRRYNLLKQK